MGGEIVGPGLVEAVVPRHLWQLGQQPLGLPGQVGGVGCRLGRHQAAQRGVSGKGVDVAFLDPVEAQTEQQVFADEDVGLHAVDASGVNPHPLISWPLLQG